MSSIRSELLDEVRALSPVALQEYLRSRGWVLGETPGAFAVYTRGEQAVDVPTRRELVDYPRRLVEAIEIVAEAEGTTVSALSSALAEPPGDTIAIRLATAGSSLGTLPLADAIRVREAAKTMLLAAAHSAILPQSFFPRLSRAQAIALLESVREGQTHRGSFVSRFIVPLAPAIGPGTHAEGPVRTPGAPRLGSGAQEEALDPFGRRVVRLLMSALDQVRAVRALGGYDELLASEAAGVSGNLLAALVMLEPAIEGGALEVSVTWSRNRAAPNDVASRVTFPSEALRGLDALAEAMREKARTTGFEIVGYVTRLDRRAPNPGAEGDVVIVPLEDSSRLGSVRVHLDGSAYAKAVDAHRDGSLVRVAGTLSKRGRRWLLSDAADLQLVPEGVYDIFST